MTGVHLVTGARLFRLFRLEDETGLSGTGVVAEGVEFANGKVAVTWGGELAVPSVTVFDSIEQVEKVHGHGGKTRIEWQRVTVEIGWS
jgi:hypothetical protein